MKEYSYYIHFLMLHFDFYIIVHDAKLLQKLLELEFNAINCEYYLYITDFTAFIIRSSFGKYSAIKVGAKGIGVSAPVTRNTGASK